MKFPIETLLELFQHMEWADAEVWRAAARHTGGVDEKLRKLLVHIHNTQRSFLQTWRGEPLDPRQTVSFDTLEAVREWAVLYYPQAKQFLQSFDPSRLDEPLVMPWVPHFEKRLGITFSKPTFGETIFQLTSHSTYHRGQVNIRLRELGIDPPLVDYIAWVWRGRPAPQWEQTTT